MDKYYILNGSYLKSPAYIYKDSYYSYTTTTHTSDGVHVKNIFDRQNLLYLSLIYVSLGHVLVKRFILNALVHK